ncbi:ABC transporter substrate-binding protein [Nonomuraea pusilla]|uniref:ABC transporter substrate-binding protein n=1 Tax=Nonomuraea pusilla TaxID=46177 RepID=UPI003317C5E7
MRSTGSPRAGQAGRAGRYVVAAAALALAAACGSGGGTASGGGAPAAGHGGFTPPKLEALKSLGPGEGQVNLVAWAGYAEDGTNDPKVDWVTPFEKATGCQVNTKVAGTSDEMVNLMKTGQYDAVSASGDASLRLIASGTVAPVNTALVPNYADVFDGLKNKPWNSVNGVSYGVPHGRGANLLMWRTDTVKPAPDSWSVVFDPNSPYKGKVTAYDSPIYIADAAVYLMATKPELGIKNPYALDDKQFQAAVDLLKQQKQIVGEYWSDYTKEIQAFKGGDSVVGTTWQVIVNVAQGEKAPVEAVLPKEGATGWSDTWMVAAKAAHPNCAYRWLDWIISPKANAQVAEYFGEAPANTKACGQTADPKHCDIYHATDEAYYSKVFYWTTPIAQCLDGRTDVTCKDYSEWTRAWTEIKG